MIHVLHRSLIWISKHRTLLLLAGVLLLAAFLRLYRISDYMTFLGDEGRDLIEVKKILSGHLVFLGPRSSAADFYYGPIYFYFITPFLWLFQYDPVGPAVFIALLGIATVYLVYHVGKELLDETAGFFAAALYAVSPLVLVYSRSSWNPNPLPFISLLLLYCAYMAVKKNSWKIFFIVGLLMGIAIQLQYLAIFLGIILFLFILFGSFFEKQTRNVIVIVKNYLIILIGFIVSWSPFIAFEIKHAFPNFRTIIAFMFFGNTEDVYVPNAGFLQNIQLVFLKFFGRLITRFPPLEQVNVNQHLDIYIWQLASIILGILAVIFLFKIKNKLALLLFSLWLFVGIFLFGFYKKQIYDYHLGFLFTLPFLLTGNLFSVFFRSTYLNRAVKIVTCLLFVFLFLFNLYANPFRFTPNKQKDQVKQIAEFVLSKTDNKPYNFALLTVGNSDHAYRYFFEINNRSPVEIKNNVVDPKRTSVTDQLLIVCEDITCKPLGDSLWEVAGFGRAEIEGEWNVSVVKVLKLRHYKPT